MAAVQKSLLHEEKLQKPLEIPIFQFASRLKIQVDSFLIACMYYLRKLNGKYRKTGVYIHLSSAKIVTTKNMTQCSIRLLKQK